MNVATKPLDFSEAIKWVAIIGAGTIAFVYLTKKAKEAGIAAAETVGEAVDPTSNENIFYRGVNAVGDVLDDGNKDESFSLGSWIYDLVNPEESNDFGPSPD